VDGLGGDGRSDAHRALVKVVCARVKLRTIPGAPAPASPNAAGGNLAEQTWRVWLLQASGLRSFLSSRSRNVRASQRIESNGLQNFALGPRLTMACVAFGGVAKAQAYIAKQIRRKLAAASGGRRQGEAARHVPILAGGRRRAKWWGISAVSA